MFGCVLEVKGPVVDVKFPDGNLPKINDALTINIDGRKNNGVAINLTYGDILYMCFGFVW